MSRRSERAARRHAPLASAALALALAVVGCSKKPPAADGAPTAALPVGSASPATREAPAASGAASTTPPTATATSISTSAADAGASPAWAFDCSEASLRTAKSIGHTSVVYKVELTNGRKAAWKPNAKKVKGRYKGEIAAHRLARALGIDNVPPVCLRSFDVANAESAFAGNDDAKRLFDREVIVEEGKVHGVLIPWIDGLQMWPLEKDPLRSEMRTFLSSGGVVPPTKLDFARQVSTLVAFDFLTSNWDRYSGENVGLDRTGTTVLFIDNDAAFMDGPPKDALARNRALLEATDRFSRGLVERVRALDDGALQRALGDGADGKPLLSAVVASAVANRAKELVAIIDAKSKAHGEPATLYFP